MSLPVAAAQLRWWGHRRRIPFGIRDRVLRLFANPDAMAPTPFTCDFFGLTYDGDLASFIDWNVYFYGSYEGGVLAFLRDVTHTIGPQAVVLDIGANVGQHSLYLARHAGHIHAFEPWSDVRGRFEHALAVNRIANVTVHPVALGDQSGDMLFHAPASANYGTGSFIPDVNHNAPLGRLPVMRGDDVLAGAERVDLIKIDTEGFEVRVLAGLREVLARHRPVVVFELSAPTVAEFAADGGPVAGMHRLFGADWRFFLLGNHPEKYALSPFEPGCAGESLNVVAAPVEKAGCLPARGG